MKAVVKSGYSRMAWLAWIPFINIYTMRYILSWSFAILNSIVIVNFLLLALIYFSLIYSSFTSDLSILSLIMFWLLVSLIAYEKFSRINPESSLPLLTGIILGIPLLIMIVSGVKGIVFIPFMLIFIYLAFKSRGLLKTISKIVLILLFVIPIIWLVHISVSEVIEVRELMSTEEGRQILQQRKEVKWD